MKFDLINQNGQKSRFHVSGTIKITKESSYDEKKKFIMEKYDQKKFIN